MAEPSPETLRRTVERFPTPPPPDDRFAEVDELLGGAYGRMTESWYPELKRRTEAYAEGDCLREAVLQHVEAVPAFRLTDGAAPLADRQEALVTAADALDEVRTVSEWYRELRGLVADTPESLSLFERALHDFGYAFAYLLFLGASSPGQVVRRLRLAYRSVGVRIDATDSVAGGERTTFTCPYRNVAAGRCGKRWACHEKLDRVDDGYVTYLAERGINYQRPRGCDGSEQCYSTVGWKGSEQWWPRTAPDAVAGDR